MIGGAAALSAFVPPVIAQYRPRVPSLCGLTGVRTVELGRSGRDGGSAPPVEVAVDRLQTSKQSGTLRNRRGKRCRARAVRVAASRLSSHGPSFVSRTDMSKKFRIALGTLLFSLSFGCGGSSYSSMPAPTPTPSPSPTGTPVSIVMGASTLTTTAYAPNPVTVAVGGTVTWTNNDSTAHTSTSNGGAWNSGAIAPGGTFSRTFSTAGSFPYHCTIHPGMVGTVNVQ